ncbi:MAG: sulfatase [Opitutales bacterium]|nr:sulfatase [Opitutales bacterium]
MKLPGIVFSLFLGAGILHAADKRLNLVLIIADDMGWDDCGIYGNPNIPTPGIDRIGREGMRFDRAFLTISSCSPSRASIITGLYPHSTDAEQLHWPLPAKHVTFVEKLKASGYWTASVGKWHLGADMKERFNLVKEADISGFQLPTGKAAKAGKFIQKGTGDEKSGCTGWIPTLRARPKDKPFFLWLAAIDPHRGYDENIIEKPTKPGDVIVPPYFPDTPEVRKDLALYYDEIIRLDKYVGLVLDELDAQKVADNTLVLFISDNGRPFPRDKTTLFDSGIRTPWLLRWPKIVRPGSVNEDLVSSIDIAPTFLELAGLKPVPSFAGTSFLPMLQKKPRAIRPYAFAEKNWHDLEDRSRAVRSKRYKYIRNFYDDLPLTPPADALRSPTYRKMQALRDEGKLNAAQMACFLKPRSQEELYDLQVDPYEMKNLATDPDHAETLKRLRFALEQWQNQTMDLPPKVRTPDEFDRETGIPTPARIRPRPSKAEMKKRLGF